MNPRLTITAAVAVAAASLSLNAVIAGNGWLFAGLGAIICVALAGSLTRLSGTWPTVGVSLLVLIAVMPLLSGPYFWVRLILAVLWVALIVTISASGRLRWIVALVSYLAVLVVYLNLVFASDKSLGGVIPTSRSMSMLGGLPRLAVNEFHYRPPVPDITAVSFFAAAGIGIVAVLVDIFAVWLRRPALAGLPLLALFSVPVASNLTGFGLGESLIFAIGLAGFLLLLATDGRQRLRMWGRLVSFRYVQPADEAGPAPDTRDIAASGRRIGLAAVCLAIVVPLVLPTMHVHDLFATSGDGNGSVSGPGGTSGSLNPMLKVQRDLGMSKSHLVLTYHTDATQPQDQYLQEYALTYNTAGNDWVQIAAPENPVSLSGTLPDSSPGLASATPFDMVSTTISMANGLTGSAVLAMPYAPVRMHVHDGYGWQEQAQSLTVSSSQSMSGMTYTVTSKEADPTTKELEADSKLLEPAGMAAYTRYHGPDARGLLRIAKQVTAGAKSPFVKALDLEIYFTTPSLGGDFSYGTRTSLPNTRGWLLKFITTEKRGDCQQFSWAFAVLARLLGIPTRIAVGYTAGSPARHATNTWDVTTADAHAWPEVYFPQAGWVRFEPTPSGSTGQGTATTPPYAAGTPARGGGGGGSTTTQNGGNTNHLGNSGKTRTNSCKNSILCSKNKNSDTSTGAPGSKPGPGFPWAILLPVLIVVLLAWPGLARIATRRRRWLSASGNAGLAHAAWREMADDLADYGFARRPSESPRALVRRIARDADLGEPAREAVRRIGSAEERARYALSAEPGAGLRADVRTARRAIAAHSPWSLRLRARLFPASTLTMFVHGLQRSTEMLGWLDMSWPSMRQLRQSVGKRSGEATG